MGLAEKAVNAMATPSTHTPLNNGEIFAGYTILRLLGSGGMDEVYLAEILGCHAVTP
jgi:hypothetical protein